MLYELTQQMLHTDVAFAAYGRSNRYIRTQHLPHTDAVETLRATSLRGIGSHEKQPLFPFSPLSSAE